MLGLGNDILHLDGASGQEALEFATIHMSDAPDSSKVFVSGAFVESSALGTVTGIASAAVNAKLGGTYSLEIIRFSAGSIIEETLSFTVYMYKYANSAGPTAFFALSTVNASSVAADSFSEGGSSLIDFDSLGISDDSADHLYKATLTATESGYTTGTISTGSTLISMTTA